MIISIIQEHVSIKSTVQLESHGMKLTSGNTLAGTLTGKLDICPVLSI